MPRPRVDAANRLRAFEACLACRTSKKRCSGIFPCANCIRRGRAATCVPCPRTDAGDDEGRHSFAYQPYPATAAAAAPVNPEVLRTPATTAVHPRHQVDLPVSNPSSQSRGPDPPSTGAQHRTHPRMLWNRKGERAEDERSVYVGKAASLSFLQLLRDTVTKHIGPSQFSHYVKTENMLETESPHSAPSSTVDDRLHVTRKEAFVRAYYAATSGFINVITDKEATQMLQEPLDAGKERDHTRSALRDVMIAIGAQSCRNDPTASQAERFFFDRGQRRAFSSMLETPSLELVRLFLCMSFYMLGGCRRNAAFMYLGVAARAAVALGLHQSDSPGSMSVGEQQQRSRVWMSLCVLDLLVSSILGRPPATATVHLEDGEFPLDLDLPSRKDTSLIASYRMCLIVDEIITQLYSEKAASADVAESLLAKLSRWRDQLPESLLTPPSEQDRHVAQEQIIGSLHVACSYHFAVILVTRPFLVSTLGVRLARLHQDLSENPEQSTFRSEEDQAHSKLSVACVDSALYMIQTCQEVHQSDLLLDNMCILKAFIFAAALVLGFSMFSQKEVDAALDTAFYGALDILRILSQQSAQAAHYLEILTFLSNAITEQRQRLASQSHHSRNRYVSKLFSLNRRSPDPADSTMGSSQAASPLPSIPQPDIQGDRLLIMPSDIDATISGWEGMDLSLWDSFPFGAENFPLLDKTSETVQ